MFKASSGAEKALGNLIGNPEEYPDKVTLPKEIHSPTLEAVTATSTDGCERATGFRYFREKWRSGRMRLGTGAYLSDDEGVISASVSLGTMNMRFPPHLSMHTHPDTNLDLQNQYVRQYGEDAGWDEDSIVRFIEAKVAHDRDSRMLPSSSDIRVFNRYGLGTVGNIVASSGGLFVCLLDAQKEGRLDHQEMERDLERYKETVAESCFNVDDIDVTSFLLEAAAIALDRRYTCFFSDDVENPDLTKVQEGVTAESFAVH